MTTAARARPRALGAELALAFLAGAAAFAVVGVVVAAIESDVPVLLVAVPLTVAVIVVARRAGVAYAVPVAMASVLAYEWYYLPPTHPHEFPDSANLAALLAYLALAVLIGQIASRAGRRATVSDAARGELAQEQAALRRMATLVARDAPPPEVFAAVAGEVGQVLEVDVTHIGHYEPDDTVTGVASWSAAGDHMPAGTRASIEGENVTALVLRTGRPARVDSYDDASGPIAATLRDLGVRSSVGAPIVVDGRLWGVAIASSKKEEPLPRDTESRIAAFTELVATAISNAEARVEMSRLAAEQAALRRVATLVARGGPPGNLLAVVAEQVARVLDVPFVSIVRYETDGTATERASFSAQGELFPVGTRWSLDGTNVVAQVRDSSRPARIDDHSGLKGVIAETVHRAGIRSTVGIPIVVAGSPWGAMVVSSAEFEPLLERTEARLADFTELVATAISNTEARTEVERLAEEQATLRRVATLVAQGVPPSALFGAVTQEVGRLLGADLAGMIRYENDDMVAPVAVWAAAGEHPDVPDRWPTEEGDPATLISTTRRPARVDDWEHVPGPIAAFVREVGINSSVGSPIVVDGRLWGALAVHSKQAEPLPADTESRLGNFTDLVATAIANAQARTEVRKLADEQAALRRVATLVARDVPPPEVFAAVAREVGLVLEVDLTHIGRYEPDNTVVGVGGWSRAGDHVPAGTRTPLDSKTVTGLVFETGRPARMNTYDTLGGPIAHTLRENLGVRSSVGAPIVVEGRLWGVAIASSRGDELLPLDTEARIAAFTELAATAISNTEARGLVRRLADEQAALRRVATLVARRAPRVEVFETVTREVGLLSGADLARMERYGSDGSVTGVAGWSRNAEEGLAVGTRFALDGVSIAALVQEQGAPARVDSFAHAFGPIAQEALELGIRSSVGCPISVEGRLWGVIAASSKREAAFPADTESQIGEFTELVATAISNAEARAELSRLAEEQAALRRVATLVARESPPDEIFATVAEQVGRLLVVEDTAMLRYEDDGTATVVASWGERGAGLEVGARMRVEGENVTTLVHRTGRPARIDDYSKASGAIGAKVRELGTFSAAGCPIVANGRLWGVMVAAQDPVKPLPAATESRIAMFTDLIATAIANTQARSDLAASRARIVATTDETRRRFERDLHDGAQQRLVSLALELKGAEAITPVDGEELRAQLSRVGDGLTGVLDDLRELSRGIHPAILSEGGLGPALRALGRRSAVPIKLDVNVDRRLEERVEVAAYYVVSEALANAAKHAGASTAEIRIEARNGILDLTIQDDGIGGADPARGSGLTGLMDRVEALGGTIAIASPSGEGTWLHVQLPVAGR